jgi:dipeptidyl aminopeptidase/acylaminoacyl peptidase
MKAQRRISIGGPLLWALVSILVPALASAGDQAASSHAAAVLDSMPHAKRVGAVTISPNGAWIAYFSNRKLSIAPVNGGLAQIISVPGDLPLRDLSWSADSKRVAFLADVHGDTPSAQVWTATADGSALLTNHAELKGYVETPRFSPDGSKLAVLFIEGMPRIAGPLQPMTPLAGVIGEKIYEQRIATIDLSNNDLGNNRFAQLTPPDMYVYEYDWTPDGRNLAVIAAYGAGDANWWIARIYRVNAKTGRMREIYKPKLQIAGPRVSPDGKSVAFIEGLMSDEGSTGGDICVVSIKGGEARNLTPDIKASVSTLAWTGPGQITFAEDIDGSSGFGRVDTASGKVEQLWTAEEVAFPAGSSWIVPSPSPDGKPVSAIVRQSPRTPAEVWVGAIGEWKQLTHINDGVKPAWGEMRRVHWTSGDLRIQGWLIMPKEVAPGKTYPLVVNVHGGPSAACMPRWDERSMGPESAMGYFGLCPNPRGSYGQGEAFTRGNVKDFGGGDFRDIMAGVDTLAKKYPIDTNRLGIRGHSYGGYMTMWAETQTHRFTAAVAGAGLSDWLSYYGLNDIDEWMIPFFGASVYDDPAVYAKSDPMHFVKAVKTPTLILVGDRDGEVPMEQSVEWWHALESLHVPTELVVYPNEGHAIMRPADAHDYAVRSLNWFEQWFAKADRVYEASGAKPLTSASR